MFARRLFGRGLARLLQRIGPSLRGQHCGEIGELPRLHGEQLVAGLRRLQAADGRLAGIDERSGLGLCFRQGLRPRRRRPSAHARKLRAIAASAHARPAKSCWSVRLGIRRPETLRELLIDRLDVVGELLRFLQQPLDLREIALNVWQAPRSAAR